MLYQQVHRSFWRRHRVVTGGGLLLTVWWLYNGWYDVVATVDGDAAFRRRFAGHVETGEDSVSG